MFTDVRVKQSCSGTILAPSTQWLTEEKKNLVYSEKKKSRMEYYCDLEIDMWEMWR